MDPNPERMKRQRIPLHMKALLLALTLTVSACGSGGGGSSAGSGNGAGASSTGSPDGKMPETKDVKIAVLRASDFMSYYIGVEKGIFERRGLNVSLQVLAPPDMPAAMVNGAVQGAGLIGRCERAGAQDMPVTVVANFGVQQPYQLIAVSEIGSIEELRGKRLLSSAASATPTLRVNSIVERAGLAGKVETVNIAKTESQVAAFRAGQGDAIYVPVSVAATVMETVPGAHVLVDVADTGPELPNTGLCVTDDFLQKNPGTVYQLIAGLAESVAFYEENRAEALGVLQEALALTQEQADFVYKSQSGTFTQYPIPTRAQWEEVARLDTASVGKPVTVDEILKETDFSIAERVIEDLKIPEPSVK
jgi:NitT/TauT family transport system substrate-binding protein